MPRKTYSRADLLRLNTAQCQRLIPNIPNELVKNPKPNTFWAPYACKPVNDTIYKDDLDRNPPAILCS